MKRQTITISILLAASLTILSGCGASNTDTKAAYEIGESADEESPCLCRQLERGIPGEYRKKIHGEQ